jgi:F-type H+-transporting ATPase subunit delta
MKESRSPATTTAAKNAAIVPGINLEVARRYADALLGAAEKEGGVEPLLAEFAEIQTEVIERFPRFAAILESPRVPVKEKDRMLVEIFDKRTSDVALKFLRVVNRHGRLDLLGTILREAESIWEKRQGRLRVNVRSAVPLEANQVDALKNRLAALLKATPVLEVWTDPSLIGGLVIEVGDHRFDASIKSRLQQIRQRLIEGKTHEIQSRRDQFSYPA